jgi:deoxyribonuclease V
MYKENIVGAVVRTKKNVQPLFISSGHMISLETSINYVLSCCVGYRLIEPTRYADKLSKKDIKMHKGSH